MRDDSLEIALEASVSAYGMSVVLETHYFPLYKAKKV